VMSRFIIKILMGQRPPVYTDGSERRDYVHVDDVNDLHMILIENEAAVGKDLTVLNVGSGKNYSILDVLAAIEEVMGVKANPESVPSVPGSAQVTLADITAARKLGWEPKMSLNEGLKGMLDYVKAEIAKGNITKAV
jgi:nucleoside-diphosphate-sugar epimerase